MLVRLVGGSIVTVAEAEARGISWKRLQASDWRRIGPGQYARPPADVFVELSAVLARLPHGAVFGGRTAGWLHGLDLPPTSPIEVIAPVGLKVSSRAGALLRRARLGPGDRADVAGLPVTSPERTVGDLAWRLNFVEAVIATDSALNRRLLTVDSLTRFAEDRRGLQGVGHLRKVLAVADPGAESPMESRLRLVLMLAGLPRPQTQARLTDSAGRLIGRADLYYPNTRLVIEYDGATHKDSLVEDTRRHNLLFAAGYQLLRFTSTDVLRAPKTVVDQVRKALSEPPRGTSEMPANRPL